jgi:hypothetical protein
MVCRSVADLTSCGKDDRQREIKGGVTKINTGAEQVAILSMSDLSQDTQHQGIILGFVSHDSIRLPAWCVLQCPVRRCGHLALRAWHAPPTRQHGAP